MKIFLHRPLPAGAVEQLRRIAPTAEFRHDVKTDSLAANLDWAEVVFGNPPAALVRERENIRWLQIVSSGFDEYASLADRPLVVTTAHGVHASSISQQVLMAMLMFARGQLHFGECQRNAQWDRNPAIPFSLTGQTLGLIGYGLIGRELARFAVLLGLRVIAVKRTATPCPPELAALNGLAGLDALLAESDHVVMTLPLTAGTRNVLDPRRVGLLKRGSYFYNIARGGLVDETALLARLHDGSLGGAALDVFAQEPLPKESPWWTAPRTLVFPHIAGHHRDLSSDTFQLFSRNLSRYVTRQPLENVADFNRGY